MKRIEPWLFAFLVACCHLVVFGYYFNCGDQAEHLPQVYQKLNPYLYPGDFFLTAYNTTFTVRFYWVECVAFLGRFIPVSSVCFILFMSCLIISIYVWIKITAYFTDNLMASYVSVILIFIVFNSFTVGGNQLQGNMFVASNPAEAFASLGILSLLRKKYFISALMLASASLFQVLVGFQLWIILSAVVLFHYRNKGLKIVMIFTLIYWVLGSPILLPLLTKQFFISDVYDKSMYYQMVYVFRSILHFKPSLFPVADYIKFLLLLSASSIILFKWRLKETKLIVIISGIIISGALLYTIMMEFFGLNFIGKMQWFKSTVWLNAFCCIIIGNWLTGIIPKVSLKISTFTNPVFTGSLGLILLAIVLNSSYIPFQKFKYRYQAGNYQLTELQITHQWIRDNTPVNAMFLVSPEDDGFACEAMRSQPVNFKAVVHEPFYFFKWHKNMEDYYNLDFSKVGTHSALANAEYNFRHIFKYPKQNLATFRLDDITKCTFTNHLGIKVYTHGNFIVTRIDRQD